MNQSADSLQSTAFATEVERIRASGALGRNTQPQRLFEFLVTCHADGRVPKEVEVAIDCFGRGAGVELAQDAAVRVAAHKLRRRLEEFYAEAGEGPRLAIPRGEYRLMLESQAAGAAPPLPFWRRVLPATPRERVAAWVAGSLAVLCAAVLLVSIRQPRVPDTLATLRDSPLWAPLLADDLPVQLVLGDYYIFGERDSHGGIRRLVRDFGINSRRDLEQGFLRDPEMAERYADLNLGYLPTSSAHALREVLPVVMASGKQVTLTLSSELDPSTLKTTHIVYLGYLSALGMLQDLVFTSSRYAFGTSFDELVDSVTGESWTSEAGHPHGLSDRYRDYAYLAALRGPGDRAHLIIAGTRDTGLMQAAEAAADPQHLRELDPHLDSSSGVEALYEVQSVNGINVAARLIEASAVAP